MKLNKNDYIDILNYYEMDFNKDLPIRFLRKMTEKIIAQKLCSCIKKVPDDGLDEARPIAICLNSVVEKKKLGIYNFACKKGPTLKLKNDANKKEDKIYKLKKGKLKLKTKRRKRTKK